MAIPIKNEEQLNKMRRASEIVAKAHQLLEKEVCAGISTRELDRIAEDFIVSQGAFPSFKGYRGFPASICVSINEEVIHGMPGLRRLKNGDIVSIYIGSYLDGYHGDAARTFTVGSVADIHTRLVKATEESFFEGMKYARAGCHLHEISGAIQKYAEERGFSVVREYVGHGIGREMHESPEIPNYRPQNRGPRLAKGMCLAIEPMVNEGTPKVSVLNDNWTVVTKDKKYSSHYENTIIITDNEPEILTLY